MSTDRISNMLSALKNAAMANNDFVETYYTKQCEGVAKVLKEAGYLEGVKTFKPKGKSYKGLRLDLAKNDGAFVLTDVIRVSKPGRRLYSTSSELTPFYGNAGVLVVSTSRGIMSGREAKRKKLGGELICQVT